MTEVYSIKPADELLVNINGALMCYYWYEFVKSLGDISLQLRQISLW